MSAIPSHPSTEILDCTLDSVRHHLPESEIILTFDGIREQQEDRRADYEEFIRRMLWRADKHYGNICPLIFDNHTHQVGMARTALEYIRTPLLMYAEQDTPLVTDYEIDFDMIAAFIMGGRSNVVRLHHEAVIPVEHELMIHGMEPDLPFLRTSQWSQRPHVASVAYYRRMLKESFSPEARSFIEDKHHGIVAEAFLLDGINGWNQHKVHIFAPEGPIKRSYHTDGRAGGRKYDELQQF